MKRSPIEQDHVREHELIATFGAARLMKDLSGKLTIVGGTDEDRRQAEVWAKQFLANARGLDADHRRA